MTERAPRRRFTPQSLHEMIKPLSFARIVDGVGNSALVEVMADTGTSRIIEFQFDPAAMGQITDTQATESFED